MSMEKEELLTIYRKVENYSKALYVILKKQGAPEAEVSLASYNLFKLPIVYVFIHYHYGRFEDLGMSQSDILSIMFKDSYNIHRKTLTIS